MSSEQDAVEKDKYGWIMASEFKPPADGPLLPYVMTMDGQPMSASRVRLLLNRLEASQKELETATKKIERLERASVQDGERLRSALQASQQEVERLRELMSEAVLDDWFCQDNDEWLAKWDAALEEGTQDEQ